MNSMRDIPPEAVAAIKAETPDEIVRWAARPNPGRACRTGFGIYVFAIPWCALTFPLFGDLMMSVFYGQTPQWVVGGRGHGPVGASLIIVGTFAAIGVAMLAAPAWVYWNARRTVYAITNRRVITIVTGHTTKVTSIPIDRIHKIERSERDDGSGTLNLVTNYGKDNEGSRVEDATKLIGVPNVRAAERALDARRTPRPV